MDDKLGLYVLTKTNEPSDLSKSDDVKKQKENKYSLLYRLDENPSWALSFALGFQHYLTAVGSTLSVPLILAGPFCLGDDHVALTEIFTTIFFVSGIVTIVQSSVGIRLPIIQGATFALLPPTISVLTSPKWACPQNMTEYVELVCANQSNRSQNPCITQKDLWQPRIREIQGAICVAAIFQVVIGCSGLVAVSLRFIGPLTIAPTISLIGLSLFEVAAYKAASHWYIAITTMLLVAIFSQYMKNFTIPIPAYTSNKKCTTINLPIFHMFPVLLAMLISWLICWILTLSGALPESPGKWGYLARTDTRSQVLEYSPWFRVPYPGQWGLPTVSGGAVLGMLAGVVASMLESLGDYYACAKLAGAPPPTSHAVNRGIAIEGLGCIFAGLMGTGNGTSSYSENVGAIGITRVGSRRVVFTAGLLLTVLGCLGKIGALFVTIPDPVVGGMFMVMFGMIVAVGISNLSPVDLGSPRNIFVLAFSLFTGLAVPQWVMRNRDSIETGNDVVDQILSVLLTTSMFVGGCIGFFLDNTIPGTLEERGIATRLLEAEDKPINNNLSDDETDCCDVSAYGIPFLQKYINKYGLYRFCPIFGLVEEKNKVTKRKDYDPGKNTHNGDLEIGDNVKDTEPGMRLKKHCDEAGQSCETV